VLDSFSKTFSFFLCLKRRDLDSAASILFPWLRVRANFLYLFVGTLKGLRTGFRGAELLVGDSQLLDFLRHEDLPFLPPSPRSSTVCPSALLGLRTQPGFNFSILNFTRKSKRTCHYPTVRIPQGAVFLRSFSHTSVGYSVLLVGEF